MRGEQLLYFGVERWHTCASNSMRFCIHPLPGTRASSRRIRCHAHHVAVALAPVNAASPSAEAHVLACVVLLAPREIVVRRILPDHHTGGITRIAVIAAGL